MNGYYEEIDHNLQRHLQLMPIVNSFQMQISNNYFF